MKVYRVALISLLLLNTPAFIQAGEYPKILLVFKGTTPNLDGYISNGEYTDATVFYGVASWTHEQGIPLSNADLSVICYAKHDGENLYFTFDVKDNIVYAYDIARWTPDDKPDANVLNQTGYPWFGDAVELMINAANSWETDILPKGDGTGWQMVCNSHKSRLDSLEKGGLMEGEPRSINVVYNRYQSWILNKAMEAVVRIKDPATEGHGYVIEWKIKPNPCLEIEPGVFWNPEVKDSVEMGLNIELEDADEKETGKNNFANFHHIEYWAASRGGKGLLKEWGRMILYNSPNNVVTGIGESKVPDLTINNYPNPVKDETTFEFSIKNAGSVSISVFDSFGRKLDMPVKNVSYNKGVNSFTWHTKNLSPGMYLYQFENNGNSIVKKLFIE